MPNIEPIARDTAAEFGTFFEAVEEARGFVPNSLLTMAHRPEILRAFATLSGAVLGRGTVDPGLKQLVALMASTSAGCRYCQAHTAATSVRRRVDPVRLAAVYEFEASDSFTPAERSALRLARHAGVVPNATTPAHFAELRQFYTDAQVVGIVSVISLFGWLNRWNDTMATELEEEPLGFAVEHLGDHGWTPGKHSAGQAISISNL